MSVCHYVLQLANGRQKRRLRGDEEPPKTIFVQPIFSAMLNLLALVQTAFKDL